jgi:hypothetical protein
MGVRAIPFGIAAVVLGFVLKSPGTQAGPADIGSRGSGISVFGTIHPDIYRLRTPVGSEVLADRVHVARLETQEFDDAPASFDERFASVDDAPVSFDKRFASFDEGPTLFDKRVETRPTSFKRVASLGDTSSFSLLEDESASFDERFSSTPGNLTVVSVQPPDRDTKKVFRPMNRPADAQPAEGASKSHVRPGQARKDAAPPVEDDGRTAIYDITARTVYLPNGRRLEAHSGLGSLMDNPRHVHVRMKGATPPNVYKLTLREQLFHGVRAIRLNPVNESKMYGRAGILAHSYMLGPNGQSNGCVSFSNYPEFLNAYLKGEITRLVVVERLDTPGPKVASGWLPDALKKLFGGSNSGAQYASGSY